jgi:hypothetical protein
MAVPVLKLNLAPPSNTWRNNHGPLGWAALALGGLVLAGSLASTWMAYQEASRAGRLAASLANKSRGTADAQSRIVADLRAVDVARELPRWRLAERIYTERSLPWSRLTSELERCMVADMRIKSIQRNRSADMKVQLKLKGEARSREAEADFVEALQKNPFFDQVILEREGERQGGGVDFDYTLAVASNPPPYKPLPKFAPPARHPAATPVAAKAAAAPRPAAVPAAPPRGPAAPVRPFPVQPSPVPPVRQAPSPQDYPGRTIHTPWRPNPGNPGQQPFQHGPAGQGRTPQGSDQ